MWSAVISVLTGFALGFPSLRSSGLTSRAVTIPQGAKWQIEIHAPIDFSGTGAVEPADAKVWTLDFWEATSEDDDGTTAIQKLRVCFFSHILA
jgi:hypothetical protein